jgi:primosomal protein N' (replication factor Y)
MVTKGHDLPNVTLVGVINADAALSMPDFRAAERTFQLLVQVAGRAGRHDRKGKVIIQTRAPEHPAIVYSSRHDVLGFQKAELADRLETHYPPSARLALLRIESADDRAAERAGRDLADMARRFISKGAHGVEVMGPAPAPIARLRARFRYRVLLRSHARPPLRSVLRALEQEIAKLNRRVRAVIDVDPVSML